MSLGSARGANLAERVTELLGDWAYTVGSHSPIIIVTRNRARERERNAFELGLDAAGYGRVRPGTKPRHLSVVGTEPA